MNRRNVASPIFGFGAIVILYMVISFIYGDPTGINSQPGDSNQPVMLDAMVARINHDQVEKAKVIRVVDGDTFIVDLNGEEVRVRLSGVDTPESVGDYKDKPEYYGQEASVFTAIMLTEEGNVWLEGDDKLLDKYGRRLAYVWLIDPSEATSSRDSLNALLLTEGYGHWFDDHQNTRYADLFSAYEDQARDMGKGLWQNPE